MSWFQYIIEHRYYLQPSGLDLIHTPIIALLAPGLS